MDETTMDPAVLRGWYAKLQQRDPKLHGELEQRLNKRRPPLTEGPAALESGAGDARAFRMVFETIVREGRPALLVKGNDITLEDTSVDELSREMVDRLLASRDTIKPLLPLVGRIDVANFAGPADFLGTGWLIESDVVVTNRHVAELVARAEGGEYRFVPGRFGEPLKVSLNYRRELGFSGAAADIVKVERVLWIEPDPLKADIAFLKVARRASEGTPNRIELANQDAAPGQQVAVVGYPARAPSHIIPDQAWMDRIYGSTYDIKRIAPGMMDDPSQGWATHDCTTLGGNSGSVVLDLATGRAVALHFAGLYMVANFAVPVSIIKDYLRRRPWEGGSSSPESGQPPARPVDANTSVPASVTLPASGGVSVTVPLTITLTLGTPVISTSSTGAPAVSIERAVAALSRNPPANVIAVRAGYVVTQSGMTDQPCVVLSAHPDRVELVRAASPASQDGFRVLVRAASIADQLGQRDGVVSEAATQIAYNDADRTGPEFSFDEVDDPMHVICHVGPERSWPVLEEFLGQTSNELVSSIYEFHAGHIANAIERELDDNVKMKLVLDPASRDHGSSPRPGEFDRSQTLDRWTEDFAFESMFVPKGNGGLVSNAYHIKVTVSDGARFWLSSGNWKSTSQPVIAPADRSDPRKTNRAGNREWHAIVGHAGLAKVFRSHILADFDRSRALGGTPESALQPQFVDVPLSALEAIEFEGPPETVLEPLEINRRVRVKPLLTPDGRGAVYCRAVLELIRSARHQLVFQNQYISINPNTTGFLAELVDALIDRARNIDDVRIILRSEGSDLLNQVSELKRRGLDVVRCVRRLPKTHTKGIVVDGRRVLVGSHNWSALGVTLNRDASLIFDDAQIAQYYLGAFLLDWKRAGELRLQESALNLAPRLAVGDSPPPGFVRMSLDDFLEG